MRIITSLAALTVVAVGISLAAGHSTAPQPAYAYGLTGNDWWASQEHAASRALDRVTPAAR